MTIQSSIKDLGLFDLFQVLHINKKTGRLIVTEGPDGKEAQIIFRGGDTCFAVIHDRVPRTISALLAEWGVIDEGSIARVENALPKYPTLIDCLEGEHIAARGHLENFLANCIRDCVYDIFKWDRGECRFIEEEIDQRRDIVIPLNTENLILEGARRIDEWSNIGGKVPSRHSIFKLSAVVQQGQRLNLKPREWEILSLIDGKRSVKEVTDEGAADLFSTSKLIYGLVVMGVIELVNAETAAASGTDTEGRLEDFLRSGREYYGRLNLETAAAQFEKALQIDPECFEALRMLGEIYYKMDKLSESLIYLSKARLLRPENQKALFIMGYLHARLGDVSKAIGQWEELKEKSANPQIVELVTKKIELARQWEKVLQEY
jgi:tetratricopeptide (TPR) repeat protein